MLNENEIMVKETTKTVPSGFLHHNFILTPCMPECRGIVICVTSPSSSTLFT